MDVILRANLAGARVWANVRNSIAETSGHWGGTVATSSDGAELDQVGLGGCIPEPQEVRGSDQQYLPTVL